MQIEIKLQNKEICRAIMNILSFALGTLALAVFSDAQDANQPHIIFIMADDMVISINFNNNLILSMIIKH